MHPCVIASRAAQPHNRVQCITMYLWLSSVVRSKDQPRVTQLSDQLQCSMRECRLSKSQTDHSCGGGCRADDVWDHRSRPCGMALCLPHTPYQSRTRGRYPSGAGGLPI